MHGPQCESVNKTGKQGLSNKRCFFICIELIKFMQEILFFASSVFSTQQIDAKKNSRKSVSPCGRWNSWIRSSILHAFSFPSAFRITSTPMPECCVHSIRYSFVLFFFSLLPSSGTNTVHCLYTFYVFIDSRIGNCSEPKQRRKKKSKWLKLIFCLLITFFLFRSHNFGVV